MSRVGALALVTVMLASGCSRTGLLGERRGFAPDGDATSAVDGSSRGDAAMGIVTTRKVDVLLMLDNSTSMADKQNALATALPDLIEHLAAVEDLHVGIITSSLGGHGASTCTREEQNDRAELLGTSARARLAGIRDPFIEWKQADGLPVLSSQIQAMVAVAGQSGCGLEAQLESIYRFLVDPFPPEDIQVAACPDAGGQCAQPVGVDQSILDQRASFLRPDSALAIVLLSDENDCSIRDSGIDYYAATLDVFLPRAATVCESNPNDPCCYSCGLAAPAGCAPDPVCNPPAPALNGDTDKPNLRCFEQKRRFGIDFLYPVERYVNALKNHTLCTTRDDLDASEDCPPRPNGDPGEAVNPLYVDGSAGRDPSMVHMLSIVGVPWQDLAVDPLASELHYFSPAEIQDRGGWRLLVGDPHPPGNAPPVPPLDPHMQESVDPRPGLPGPDAAFMTDPIEGHEWNISQRSDLQYACIFGLPVLESCVDANCDCFKRSPGDDNPVCQNPNGQYEQVQRFARAYPGLRELSVIEKLGTKGRLASICPRNLRDSTAQDYGYRPAIEALAVELARNVK